MDSYLSCFFLLLLLHVKPSLLQIAELETLNQPWYNLKYVLTIVKILCPKLSSIATTYCSFCSLGCPLILDSISQLAYYDLLDWLSAWWLFFNVSVQFVATLFSFCCVLYTIMVSLFNLLFKLFINVWLEDQLSKKHWLFRDLRNKLFLIGSNPLFQIIEMNAIIIVFGLMNVLQNL